MTQILCVSLSTVCVIKKHQLFGCKCSFVLSLIGLHFKYQTSIILVLQMKSLSFSCKFLNTFCQNTASALRKLNIFFSHANSRSVFFGLIEMNIRLFALYFCIQVLKDTVWYLTCLLIKILFHLMLVDVHQLAQKTLQFLRFMHYQ